MSAQTTTLERPDVRWHESWAQAMGEFDEEYPNGSALADPVPSLDEAGCVTWVAALLRAEHTPPRPDWVTCDYLWIVDEDEVVGFLSLRHELNDWLLQEGGHIGYSVRPSRRRRGYAARALALSLERAAGRGLDRVLVTCDEDNEASRRTIEANGGVYEDSRNGKRRYWIAITP